MNGLAHLSDLNRAQRAAVEFGVGEQQTPGPLLIIAGAGTGKTNTLAHRVAHLILHGTAPERILLLTFTRRAAAEMTRRAQRILVSARASAKLAGPGSAGDLSWSGTFHARSTRHLPCSIAPTRRTAFSPTPLCSMYRARNCPGFC